MHDSQAQIEWLRFKSENANRNTPIDRPCKVVDIQTLRRRCQLAYVRERFLAQMPWQRALAREVRRRLDAA